MRWAAAHLDAAVGHAPQASDASRARASASEAALRVTRSAVQMHGGIGYTDEFDIGLFLRKAMVIAPAYGSADWHRRRFVRLARASA